MRRSLLSAVLGILLFAALPVSAEIVGTGAPEAVVAGQSQNAAPPEIVGTGSPSSDDSAFWSAVWLVVSSL